MEQPGAAEAATTFLPQDASRTNGRGPEVVGAFETGMVSALVLPLLLVLFAGLVRAPSWPVSVFDWDESMFALSGRELLRGHLPYTTVFDNKPFGLSALFAAAMALGGESLLSVRLLGAACVAVTAILLYRITLSIIPRRSAAFGAGLLYVAFSTGLHGLETHTEIALAPFTTAGMLVAVRALGSPRIVPWATIAGVGLLFGSAISIKQVAAVPAAAAFLVLATQGHARGRTTVTRTAGLAFVFAASCCLPLLLTVAFYWTAEQLPVFWYFNFGFMGSYVSEKPSVGEAVRAILKSVVEFWPLLLLATAGPPSLRRRLALEAARSSRRFWGSSPGRSPRPSP